MGDTEHSTKLPWLFDLRSSKQLIGLAVFATTFTDGFLYGIVSPRRLCCRALDGLLLILW